MPLSGLAGQRACLYVFELTEVVCPPPGAPRGSACLAAATGTLHWQPSTRLVAEREFIAPDLSPGRLAPPAAIVQARAARITKARAVSEAGKALRRKFGRVYRRGTRKKLSCVPSGNDYVCSFRFRHGTARHAGTIIVRGAPILPGGGP